MDNTNKEILETLSSVLMELKDVKNELQQVRSEIASKNKMIDYLNIEIKSMHAAIAVLSGHKVNGEIQSYIDAQNIGAINTVEAAVRLNGSKIFKH